MNVLTPGRRIALTALFSILALPAVAASVGSGSPNQLVQQSFIIAYSRGQFASLVGLPTKDVRAYGNPGLVQEFPARVGTATYALVKPDPTVPAGGLDTLQVYGDMYAYYNSIGVSVVGYPANDTTACPTNNLGTCQYQIFTKNYALFVYTAIATNLFVKDPYFTEWTNLGGIGPMGAATSAETAVVSVSGVQGTQQLFATGSIFSYPTGTNSTATIGIADPLNSAFNSVGGYAQLGFPTSEALTVSAAGLIRQTFEKGRIELAVGGTPVVLFSVDLLGIVGQGQGLNLSLGASATIFAFVDDTTNQPVSGRALSWSTSNGNVVRVVGNGDSATIQAVGPGSANIYVSGEGKSSLPFTVRVGSGCCAVGEGAPAAVSQAFQSAVQRNHLSLQPASAPVTRVGNGYIQTVSAADGSVYVISEADNSGLAFVIGGSLNAAYLANGGFAGILGYPVSDAANGAQKFSSGAALAGAPVRIVPSIIASKWFQIAGPSGPAGQPVADAVSAPSLTGVTVLSQNFSGGTVFGISSGSKAGQAFFSSGLILARYAALSGPAGSLGLPQSDVLSSGPVQTENFENGYIDLQPGAASAVEHLNPRHPAITLTPSSVTPGGRIHIATTGFAPGTTIAFTITGQPAFSVPAPSGSFSWDLVIPRTANSGTVTVQASAQGSADSAAAAYVVNSVPAARPILTILSGDRQTGLPGGTLPFPIVALLRDSAGNPLPGVPVTFDSSPGANAQSSFVTGPDGQVSVSFRLPPSSGVAVGSLKAGAQVAEFSAIAAAKTIGNVPVFSQVDSHGAVTAALATLIRYSQNVGSLPVPNGLATPAVLNQFLSLNSGIASPMPTDAIANPWVAAKFASAGVFVEAPTLDHVRDSLSSGIPVAIVLSISIDSNVSGGGAVDAIGVADDGSIVIDDPNPLFARSSLADYLNGFSVNGHQVTGTVTAVLRVGVPTLPANAMPFTVSSSAGSGASVASPAVPCAQVDLLDSASPDAERFHYCDGSQSRYELDFTSAAGASVVDLSGGPAAPIAASPAGSVAITRMGGQLTAATQVLAIDAVTDSAAFTAGISPGGLITIFGSGLAAGPAPVVTINGRKLVVLASFPFQVNAQVPVDALVGSAQLQVSGPLGTASRSVTITPVSPGIFIGGTQSAIVNQDGSLNNPASPAQRGQYVSIYGSGLGTTTPKGGLQTTAAAVTVVVNGVSVVPSFAGLAPGFIGLYQVNVTIPANSAPSLAGTILLRESGQASNSVPFAVQ